MVSAEVGMKKSFVRTSLVGLAGVFLIAGLSMAADPAPSAPKSGATKPTPAAKRDPHHPHQGKHGAPGGAKAATAPMPYPAGLIERNAKRLGVDEATVKKMRQTMDASKAENDKLRKQIEGEQVALRKLMEQDVPDEAAVMAHADKVGALIAEQRKTALRAVLKVRGMLTPQQRAELAKIRGR
jgi:hypothetical protein